MGNKKGQVLPYMLVMTIVLILSWAMMLNIAKVLRDKMILQNTVDNAAISIANLSARTLNLLGQTNYLMATVLSTAGYPESLTFDTLISTIPKAIRNKVEELLIYAPRLYVPSFSTDKICGSMVLGLFCDYKCHSINTQYKGVKNLRETVQKIQKIQDLLIANYATQYLSLLKSFSKDNMQIVVIPSKFAEDITDFNFWNFSLNIVNPRAYLGIKKNSKKIKYYKTKNYCFNIKAVHAHFVKAEEYKTDEYSWYVQDENFYDKKFVAFGRKSLNKNYPLFKRVFNINMPSLIAVSAAGLYNVKGPMFPEKETVSTGANLAIATLSSFTLLAKQSKMLITLANEVSAIPLIGWAIAAVVYGLEADMMATAIYNFYKATDDKQTPIYKYNQAKDGGWDSHLVPL